MTIRNGIIRLVELNEVIVLVRYKVFPKSNLIREWDELIKLNRDEVVKLYEEWKDIHEENEKKHKEMIEKRKGEIEEIATFLKSKGIDVYKYKRKGFFREKNGYMAWFRNNITKEIEKKYPSYRGSIPTAHFGEYEIDGIRVTNNQSPTNIVELYDRIKRQYHNKKEEELKNNKLLVKSIKYAEKHDIDIEYLNSKEIISVVADYAKDKYLEEHVPDGSKIYLKHECDYCDTYIVGERRCSCGNRRIHIVVEGNLIDGFYHYPEGY